LDQSAPPFLPPPFAVRHRERITGAAMAQELWPLARRIFERNL
jgi:hypothetical protein